ncbi:hypothetical protein U6S23_12280, partial [Cutibacterium acnes]
GQAGAMVDFLAARRGLSGGAVKDSSLRHCERSEAIHAFASGEMDCFVAEPVIVAEPATGRAYARPIGSSQ